MNTKLLQLGFVAPLVLATLLSAAETVKPKILTPVSPGYPAELTDSGLSGAAEVDIIVKADGTVADPKLGMASHRAFGRAAMEAVVNWKFEPAKQDGTAVDAKAIIPFRFTAPTEQVLNAMAHRKVFVALPEPALTDKEFPTKKLKVKQPARAPQLPRNMNAEEKVQVKLVVAPDGTTLNPAVVNLKHKDLEMPAIQAVAMMKYEPPMKDGKAVYVETTTTVEFTNDRGGGGGGAGFGGGGGGGNRRNGGGGGGGMGGGGFGGGGFGED